MHYHQGEKQGGQIKVDVAPFVPGHGEKGLNFAEPSAAGKLPAASTGAGRQYELYYKAGKSQTEQVEKADRIDDKIQRSTFHCICTSMRKEITLTISKRRFVNSFCCMRSKSLVKIIVLRCQLDIKMTKSKEKCGVSRRRCPGVSQYEVMEIRYGY
jgi:hypothetical protein